ncbi:MAG: hypothetical protein ACI86H_002794, partial [bacterium]
VISSQSNYLEDRSGLNVKLGDNLDDSHFVRH